MTREEKLYSMTMKYLAEVAEAEGIKIDKKGSKQKAVEKILAYEAAAAEVREEEEKALTETAEQQTETAEETTAEETTAEQPKKERKERRKKEQTVDVSALLEFIIDEWQKTGGIVKVPAKENAVFRALCVENGRQVLKLMWTTKKISFFTRIEAATAHAETWQRINYAMPFQCMFAHDTEEARQNIKDIFQLVRDVDSVRPKKERKAKKQKEK